MVRYSYTILFLLIIRLGISQTNKVPGEGNLRYQKKGLHFLVFKGDGKGDTLEGTFVKSNGHTKNFIKLKGEDLFPNKVDSIYLWSKTKEKTSDTMKAVSMNDMFLFNTVTGQLKCYSLVPYNDKKYSIYFQNQSSELFYNTNDFRKNVLPEWVKDDKETYEYWKEYRRRKMLRIVGPLATVAVGLTLTGVLSKSNPDAAGLAFVASNTWAFWFFIKPIHPSKIIEKYNANKRKDEKFFTE